MYCVIDIETTGGSKSYSKITEIAIYRVDENGIEEVFQSLINPECPIPYSIQRLTGITDKMVADAPLFKDIADKIEKLTADQVFVAHNVNFDYPFIQAAFNHINRSYRRKKLCTVRLSRKILPGHPSYSLGKLCKDLNIPIEARHRAAGDAKATAKLLQILIKKDKNNVIQNALKPQSLEALLPPHLPKEEFLALPQSSGIYYLKDQNQKKLYIGQAKNIKKRVHSHFSGNTNTGGKHLFMERIHSVDYKEIESPLHINLIEASEIKKHWPPFNRSLKSFKLNHALYYYEDRNAYLRFSIGKAGKHDHPLRTFKTLEELKYFLREIIIKYELCPRLAGLQPISSGACNYFEEITCKGACCGKEKASEYNKRFFNALENEVKSGASFLIKENIQAKNQLAVVLVEKGRYKGCGTINSNLTIDNPADVMPYLQGAYDDQDMAMLVQSHLYKLNPSQIQYF